MHNCTYCLLVLRPNIKQFLTRLGIYFAHLEAQFMQTIAQKNEHFFAKKFVRSN